MDPSKGSTGRRSNITWFVFGSRGESSLRDKFAFVAHAATPSRWLTRSSPSWQKISIPPIILTPTGMFEWHVILPVSFQLLRRIDDNLTNRTSVACSPRPSLTAFGEACRRYIVQWSSSATWFQMIVQHSTGAEVCAVTYHSCYRVA